MAPPLVDNSQIKHAELLTPRPTALHAYVWPFTIIWPIFLAFYLTPDLYERYIGASEWTFVWSGTIITLQSLVWLCTHWSVNLKALFTAKKVQSVDQADLIKVIPIWRLTPDGRGERFNFPGQTCPDPLIALTRRASAADNSDSTDNLVR